MNVRRLAVAAMGTGALLCAQAPAPREIREDRNFTVTVDRAGPMAGEAMPVHVMQMMPFEMGMATKTVKNSPYSAEGITEFKQQLADGNRITRRTVDHVYRDSQGRTRKETTIANVGQWAAGGQKMITIADPAAGSMVVLDSGQKTARKTITRIDAPEGGERVRIAMAGPGMASGGAVRAGAQASTMVFQRHPAGDTTVMADSPMKLKFRREELGKRMFDGVEATGTRAVQTIEAGSMGNERDIEIVSERWFSDELGVVVKSVQNDPRSGETTYTLSNIRRAEPAADLFEVPADFKVNETQNFKWVEKIEKIEKK